MLLCPVCNKSLVDLYRLNQHLDEVHFKVVEKQETVKSWFKKCVEEAKHLASVAVAQNIINRSDVFELNENKVDYGETGREIETVTKEHWKIGTEDTVCSRVSCKKPLSVKADRVNCGKCGELFCHIHTMYQVDESVQRFFPFNAFRLSFLKKPDMTLCMVYGLVFAKTAMKREKDTWTRMVT